MSSRSHTASFALAADGTLLLNIAAEVGDRDLRKLLEAARQRSSRIFIGITLKPAQARVLRARLAEASVESAALIAASQRRGRRRS